MECGDAMTSPAARVQELGRLGGRGEVAVCSCGPLALFMAIWSRSAWPYFSFFSTSIRRSSGSQPVGQSGCSHAATTSL